MAPGSCFTVDVSTLLMLCPASGHQQQIPDGKVYFKKDAKFSLLICDAAADGAPNFTDHRL